MNTPIKHILHSLFTLILSFYSLQIQAQETVNKSPLPDSNSTLSELMADRGVTEGYSFHGLASYYNTIDYFVVTDDNIRRVEPETSAQLSNQQWLVGVSRLKALVIQANGLRFDLTDGELFIDNPQLLNSSSALVQAASKDQLAAIAPELNQIRYNHLWIGLAQISKAIAASWSLLAA